MYAKGTLIVRYITWLSPNCWAGVFSSFGSHPFMIFSVSFHCFFDLYRNFFENVRWFFQKSFFEDWNAKTWWYKHL